MRMAIVIMRKQRSKNAIEAFSSKKMTSFSNTNKTMLQITTQPTTLLIVIKTSGSSRSTTKVMLVHHLIDCCCVKSNNKSFLLTNYDAW